MTNRESAVRRLFTRIATVERRLPNIVLLSGAGLSAESGLGTFRDVDGLWTKYDLSEVATPEGFARDPVKVLDFYNARRRNALAAEPNAAHTAIATLEAQYEGALTIVTQNIDRMLERAGTKRVIHMHGEIERAKCNACEATFESDGDLTVNDTCGNCDVSGGMRPDVVWFGEIPYALDDIATALANADLFVSIGTSGTVYPAAGFVMAAREAGAHTIEMNLEPAENASVFAESRQGPATATVPHLVDELLTEAKSIER